MKNVGNGAQRALILAALTLTGCGTQFMGEAQFPEGVSGCRAKCQKDGLQMGAFVYLGEYTSGCVCERKGTDAAPAGSPSASASTRRAVATLQAVGPAYQTHIQQLQAAGVVLGVVGMGQTVYLFSE